ncbi:hypothetical protein [Streptomyces sp. CB02923]|uniref:hypothetical protein n=1 Tax=Streptomyces sp. CB02923 TaxID=1718985 RepID=UPI0009A0A509|nr:hypothetical protein [Streptomyces sp. CB02923]
MPFGSTVPGCAVALIGIDGAGKSTLAGALRDRLAARDEPAVLLSRRHYLKTRPEGFVGDTMAALYGASLRTLYGFADVAGGGQLGRSFPPPAGDLLAPEFERTLNDAAITGNSPHALMASMLCEVAGHLMFRRAVVEPAVAAGRTVVEDTHGIKMVVKQYLLARSLLDPLDEARVSLDAVLELAMTLLQPPAQTSLPVLVRVAPEVAYARRVAQHGRVGGMEHFGPTGRPAGRESYLELQRDSQTVFEDIGKRWQCLDLDLSPSGEEDGVRAGVERILAAKDTLTKGPAS